MFVLVDVNNFYVLCEKALRPDLKNTPVLVMSNNDGIAITRSPEVKARGIKMGVPFYQIKALCEQHNVQMFSSNYSLYAEFSARVMSILEENAPEIEIYSIDEVFLNLSGIENYQSFEIYGQNLRKLIYQYTKLTVGVGIAPTKTLAKLANYAAKKWPKTNGVVVLDDQDKINKLMSITPVEEVWGVGRRLTEKLTSMVLEEVAPTKQQIVVSRSFGEKVTDYPSIKEAVCKHAERAAEKLRKEQRYCKLVSTSVRTSRFNTALYD